MKQEPGRPCLPSGQEGCACGNSVQFDKHTRARCLCTQEGTFHSEAVKISSGTEGGTILERR